jgi:hypothetical protein
MHPAPYPSKTRARDWNSLLISARPQPTGLQEAHVFNRLVDNRQTVSGLLFSIGVSTPPSAEGKIPATVGSFIRSLLGPEDFATQSGAQEFLLIYPQERGASAQRRLMETAQRLWDFQLSSAGASSILFCWGGVEVQDESIDEAIASATERMQETRRRRKRLASETF